jgi:hypothetical protein
LKPSQNTNVFDISFFSLLILCLFQTPGHGKPGVLLYVYGGYSYHYPANMSMTFSEYSYKINNVHFSSQSFRKPIYYGISAGWAFDTKKVPIQISLEFFHDKIYVIEHQPVQIKESNDPNLQVERTYPFEQLLNKFSMSHGFNFLLLKISYPILKTNLLKKELNINLGIAGGGLIPHVESQHHHNKKEQYEFHLPAGKIELIGKWSILENFSIVAGFKITGVKVKNAMVVGGHLSTVIVSRHFILGIGL